VLIVRGELDLRTVYLVDRVALQDSWLICRRGFVFVGRDDGSEWHAVLYDVAPKAADDVVGEGPLPFMATTPYGHALGGVVQVGRGDAQIRMLYLAGVGRLREAMLSNVTLE
jgi:hypothetical protein